METSCLKMMLWILIALLFTACVPAPKEDTVQVKTEGVFVEATFEVVGGNDLGEVLTGGDPVIVTMNLINNSRFEFKGISLSLDASEASSMGMTFALTEEGIDAFPGKGGTCEKTLAAGATCTIMVAYNPNRSGIFNQIYTLTYKNYVKEIKNSGELKVLTGEPASLVFTNEETLFNYGVIEQTEPEVRYELMKIENRGGLSARNVNVTLNSSDVNNAFSLVKHDCPQIIKPGKGCEALVSYVPLNILETDPEVTYSSNLNFQYIKDGKVAIGQLNSFYTFKSTKIQGNFDTNLAAIEFTPSLVVGNKDTQNFRIVNKGYREAVLKVVIFKDAAGVAQAECKKPASGMEMDCFLPGTSTPATLAQNPFKVMDLDGCAERDAYGSITGTAGEPCDFSVTFWPSVTYLSNMSFINWGISMKYDTRWKGLETIVTEDLFVITADSLAAAVLSFESFTFGSGNFPPDADPSMALSFFDIGRVALISNAAYFTPTSIRLKNYGPSPAQLVSILDGQATAQAVSLVPTNILSVSDPGFTTTWQNMSTNCTVVDSNQFCSISGRFVPLFYSNEARQDRLFLDVEANNVIQGPNRYKRFIASYKDGTTYEDDGSLRIDRTVEFRVTGLLITKGFLVFQNILGGNIGNKAVGSETKHKIILQNVGTGRIPYIKLHDTDRLYHLNMPFAPSPGYDTTIIADPPPGGVTKDCYTITDFDNTYLDNPNPPKGFLDPNETCSITALMKRANYDTFTQMTPPDPDYKRCIYSYLDGTYDQWERGFNIPWGGHDIRFSYYDGDGGLGLASPYLDAYGFYLTLPAPYSININWRTNACIVAREPTNLYNSSLLYRPAINYPPIVGAPPTGWPWQFSGNTIPEVYFPTLAIANDTSKQLQAINHVQAFEATDVDYIYHMGTFPANGETFQGTFSLESLRMTQPVLNSVSISPGVPELTMVTTFPGLPANYGGGSLTFNFASNSSGIFQRDVTMVYNNGLVDRTRKFRIIAEAVTPFANVSVKSQEYSVVIVAGTPIETLNGPIQDPINSKFLNYDLGFNDTFFAVKGSTVYAKKQYTITNTTAIPITNLNVYWQGAINAQSQANAPTGNGMTLLNIGNCTNISLAPAASCTFELKWQPPTISSALAGFLAVQYTIAPDQYISKSHRVVLNAGDPAKLTVQGMSTVQVQDNNDGGFTRSSYPVDWGAITVVGHIQTVNYPHTVSKTGYWVRNSSALKASFLKMLEPGVIPGGNPVLIYNIGGRKVYATRACLYGDDELDAGVPADEKGFNVSTVANCVFTVEYDANETFAGKDIDEKLNVMKVEFYNNRRSSTDFIWFHLKGFVEPNFSTAVGGYTGVTALNNGSVTIGWPAFSPQNAAWGSIVGYTIFQTQTTSLLDNVHTTAATKVDVAPTTFSHTFNGLQVGRYYYFKVVARRTKNGKTYYSENKPMGKVTLVVPPANTIYSHSLAGVIDRVYQSGFGNKTTAVSNCASKFYSLVQGGLTVNKYRQLMNTNVWNYLKTDPDSGGYTTYSNYAIPAVSHWLIDAPTDIAPIFAPYGFDTTATTQYVPAQNLLYQKPCNDNSCNLLDKIVGGDGSELPFDATLYIKGNAGGGVFRCWAPI